MRTIKRFALGKSNYRYTKLIFLHLIKNMSGCLIWQKPEVPRNYIDTGLVFSI